MIEGLNAIVIFDGQLLLPYADEVASYVQTLGKPVDRIQCRAVSGLDWRKGFTTFDCLGIRYLT
jgi:hypothetical protein